MVVQSVSAKDRLRRLFQSDEGARSGVQLQNTVFVECDRHAQHPLFYHHRKQISIVTVVHLSEHGVSLSHFAPSLLLFRSRFIPL